MGRLLAIGDVHGCFAALQCLFSFAQIDPNDQLVLLGDYVDRGPDSKMVLEFLIKMSEARPIVALRGNHELMMLSARLSQENLQRWYVHGGAETLASYAHDADDMGRPSFADTKLKQTGFQRQTVLPLSVVTGPTTGTHASQS